MKDQNSSYTIIQNMRAIAILMVVMHHAVNALHVQECNAFVLLINRIHVNVFFVISGFFFQKKCNKYCNDSGFVKTKFMQLMVPYFAFSGLFSTLMLVGYVIPGIGGIISSFGPQKSIFEAIVDIILFRNVYFESLWYVYVLFLIFVLSYIAERKRILPVSKMLLMTIAIFTICVKAYIGTDLWLIINKVITYFVWFYAGRVICEEDYSIDKSRAQKVYPLVSIFMLIICAYRITKIDLFSMIGSRWLRALYVQFETVVFSISGVMLVYFISLKINERIKTLKVIGDYSYDIYLVHNPWIISSSALILQKILKNQAMQLCIVVIISVGLPIVISKFLSKYFSPVYKFLFGKGS